MKTHWFSVLSVAGILLLTGSAFGNGLQWKTPATSTPVVSSVTHIPTIITTDDSFLSVILQAQHIEPIVSLPPLPPALPQQVTVAPAEPFVPSAGATVLPMLPTVVQARMPERIPCSDMSLQFKPITDISHCIRPTHIGELPQECYLESRPFYGRHFAQTCYMWTASGLSTRMAYFEDVQLERHGHTKVRPVFQPVVSGARFFGTIPLLPYKMGVTPPNERVYTLGHIRSGSYAPYMREPFPLSLRGALWQAGAVTGAAFAAP